MPSTTTSDGHGVVTVPFTNGTGARLRPAVVVSSEKFHRKLSDVIVCPISSQPRYFQRSGPGDRPLDQWSAAGLRHPSTVRVSKILAMEKASSVEHWADWRRTTSAVWTRLSAEL